MIGGELHVSPAPTPEHQRLVGRLYAAFFRFLEASEQGEVFQAPTGLRLTLEDVDEPDLFVVISGGKARVTAAAVVGAPALIAEAPPAPPDVTSSGSGTSTSVPASPNTGSSIREGGASPY